MSNEYVYILVSADKKMFKVGKANNVSNRLMQLERFWKFSIEDSYAFECSSDYVYKLERLIHRLLTDYRINSLDKEKEGHSEFFKIECFDLLKDKFYDFLSLFKEGVKFKNMKELLEVENKQKQIIEPKKSYLNKPKRRYKAKKKDKPERIRIDFYNEEDSHLKYLSQDSVISKDHKKFITHFLENIRSPLEDRSVKISVNDLKKLYKNEEIDFDFLKKIVKESSVLFDMLYDYSKTPLYGHAILYKYSNSLNDKSFAELHFSNSEFCYILNQEDLYKTESERVLKSMIFNIYSAKYGDFDSHDPKFFLYGFKKVPSMKF